eukprot:m.180858 g.180858  ORF g.180858 m.180858 type:complete len:51 (+) comp9992_c0_seq27:622-774(+)
MPRSVSAKLLVDGKIAAPPSSAHASLQRPVLLDLSDLDALKACKKRSFTR